MQRQRNRNRNTVTDRDRVTRRDRHATARETERWRGSQAEKDGEGRKLEILKRLKSQLHFDHQSSSSKTIESVSQRQ